MPVAAREEIECDLPEFDSGLRYMLVCVDVFSKVCAAVPMDDRRPETVVAALQQCFAELGIPVRIYTDKGGEFGNKTMDEFLASLQDLGDDEKLREFRRAHEQDAEGEAARAAADLRRALG